MAPQLLIRRILVRPHGAKAAQRIPVFGATAPAERNAGLVTARPAVNWQDELPSVEQPPQDPELRRLVDLLPEQQRHMVERVYFGGASARLAAEELGLQSYKGERQLRYGLRTLRGWIENGDAPKRDPARKREKIARVKDTRKAWETLDGSALETTMSGRYRGDGRRLDSYVLHGDGTETW